VTRVDCVCGWHGTSETWASHVCWGGGRPLANGIIPPQDDYEIPWDSSGVASNTAAMVRAMKEKDRKP